MTTAIQLDDLARICTGRMLNSALEGIAIGLFAWILLRLVGRRNSSTRFAVWFSALLAIAVLPVLGHGASNGSGSPSAVTVPGSWALGVFAVWALVASVALLRVGVGLLQLRKLRQSCIAIDAATLHPVLREMLQRFQAVRSVALCQSDLVRVPTAIGFVKPLVVIPAWAMEELSTAELNSILIHELAHLRRWDDWTNLAQQVLKALLFFHPAVWWIENKLALEREMACDDAVLAETANPKGYAQCLVSIAEKSFMRRSLAMAQAAVNHVRQTSLRVTQILDVNRSSATRVWKPALYAVAAFSVVCLVSLSRAPELVAFEDRVPEVAIASATPAKEMQTSAAGSNFIPTNAVATPLMFHPQDTSAPAAQRVRFKVVHRFREGTSSLVPQTTENQSGFQPRRQGIRESANSPVAIEASLWVAQRFQRCDTCVRTNEGFSPELAETRFSATAVAPPMTENQAELPLSGRRIWDSGSSLVAQTAENELEFQSPTVNAVPVKDEVLTQAILVVMRAEQYTQAGPTLWRLSVWQVVVFDSGETRLPAKRT